MSAQTITPNLDAPRKQIPSAEQYEIDVNGFVYRRGKRLQLQSRCGKWFAQVYRDSGERWSFDSERLAATLFGLEPATLTREDILTTLAARIIPDYPGYAVTSYGAIYCIEPPSRGPNAGTLYLVKETLNHDSPHVNLTRADGSRVFIEVDKVVEMVWGY